MATHTEWLGRGLESKIEALKPAESLTLLHYLIGYFNGNLEFKDALAVAALEGEL